METTPTWLLMGTVGPQGNIMIPLRAQPQSIEEALLELLSSWTDWAYSVPSHIAPASYSPPPFF